jgi:WD40 repeat protein
MKYQLIIMLLFLSISVIAQQDITTINQSISPKGDTIKPASKKLRTNNYKVTSSSEEAIKAGKAAAAVKRFGDAISYYFGAEAYDPTRRNEIKGLVNKAFSDITKLKNEAEISERKAKTALIEADIQRKKAMAEEEKAKKALADAEIQRAKAIEEGEKAKIAEKKAKAKETEAKAALAEADIQRKKAIEEGEKAKKAEAKAIKEERIAKEEKARAERLRIEALSTAIAIKSADMKYKVQDTIKTLLSLRAYDMQMTVKKDTLSEIKGIGIPDIYTSLHSSLSAINGSNYDEVRGITTPQNGIETLVHNGIIRYISHSNYNTIYTSGSDGKLIKWKVAEWKSNGRPIFESITIIQEKENLDLVAAITKTTAGEDIIALGGWYSNLELITPIALENKTAKQKKRYERRKKRTRKKKEKKERKEKVIRKNIAENYKVQKNAKSKIGYIKDLAFHNDTTLCLLGDNNTLEILNIKTNKIIISKQLNKEKPLSKKEEKKKRRKEKKKREELEKSFSFIQEKKITKAQNILIHPNGQLMTILYNTGIIEFYNINFLDSALYSLDLSNGKVRGDISSIVFDTNANTLAIGTTKGDVALIPEIDGEYHIENLIVREVNLQKISSIDFQTYISSNQKPYTLMAVGCYNGTVSIWDIERLTDNFFSPIILDNNKSWVTALEFVNETMDSQYYQLMVGYSDGTFKFWNLDMQSLANELKCVANEAFERNNFKKEEIETYRLDTDEIKIKPYAKCNE